MDNPGNTTMDPTKKFPKNSRPFSFYLLLSMVILVICIVGFLTVNDYFYTRNNFNQESHLLQVQTEQNIRGAMRYGRRTVLELHRLQILGFQKISVFS